MDLFDGHCDTMTRCYRYGYGIRENFGNQDLTRAEYIGKWGQFFALFADEVLKPGVTRRDVFRAEYAIFQREMELNRDRIVQCRTGAEARAAFAAGKRAAFLSIEGADLIDCTLDGLQEAWEMGVRAINPVWNAANILCGTTEDEAGKGLTAEGKAFVRKMTDLHMLVDVSHMSDPGFWDVAELVEGPFMASHSCSRALCGHVRNLTDDMFREIVRHNGVAGINMYRTFLGEPTTVDTVIAHMEHFLSLGGEKNVCMGGDLDGCYDEMPDGIDGIQDIGKIYDRMLQRNYSEELVHAIFFDNMTRVVNEVCTM